MPSQKILDLIERCKTLPHGTRARYAAKCRCDECRTANREYARRRTRQVIRGIRNPIVPADAARKHLRQLAAAGIGTWAVADVTGLSRGVIQQVRMGQQTQLRLRSEELILGVDKRAISDSTLVSAAPTWRILDGLVSDGYTKTQLAKWLGLARAIQFRRDRVTAKTALRVRKLAAAIKAGQLRRDR
jgi:hypothetical protein